MEEPSVNMEDISKNSASTSLDLPEFDQEACRSALVKMFVLDELPYWLVERESFRKLLSVIQPMFEVPSHATLLRDIIDLYHAEKIKLHEYLSSHCRRVCLIIDTWTSNQDLNYMSLTARFIDNDWKLHRKILNFCQVTSYSGEVMAKSIAVCLKYWDLNEVVSLTIDNVLSNDLGIQYLKKTLISWNSIILKSGCIHVHCYAHILSLIVKEGLKEIGDSIVRIRGAVKYISSSPSILARFKEYVKHEKIQYNDLVCVDVEASWDTTYVMLEAALKHQKAFELLKLQDSKYVNELNGEKVKGVPSEDDWEHARSLLPFLKMFYESSMRICGTSNITSDIYMKEVFGIRRMIYHYCEDNDLSIRLMASKMKNNCDKYWGNPNAINMLLLIAVVFDPRLKLDYVNWYLDYFFDSEKASDLKSKLFSVLGSLYNYYQGTKERSQHDQQDAQMDEVDDDLYGMGFYLQSTGRKSYVKSELDRYLNEYCEPYNEFVEFDLLSWWKVSSSRFPILANMAQGVLAIPVSAEESDHAFSTERKVLDPYHSSLPPKLVGALVCTKDWIEEEPFSLLAPENF